MRSHRQVAEDYFEAVRNHDFPGLSDLRHDDFIQEWHQMGERTRGKQNARLINENHPGLPKPTIRRILEGPDFCVAETTLEYPDGSVWQAVNIFEFKDGLIARQTDYFGAPLAAPAWRAGWVERMQD
jgi:ketosteroid isomerase-like protein